MCWLLPATAAGGVQDVEGLAVYGPEGFFGAFLETGEDFRVFGEVDG